MKSASISGYLNVHTHFKPRLDNETIIRNAYTCLTEADLNKLSYPVSIGVHPWHILRHSKESCLNYLELHSQPVNVAAIGETGLDYSRKEPRDLQLAFFELHFNLAQKIGKPLIVHAVKSYYDFIPYLKKSKVPLIFHGFNGNSEITELFLSHDAYFSFGKSLFNHQQAELFSEIPATRILLETDQASHLHIADIYRRASEIMGFQEDQLKELIFANAKKIFPGSALFV